MATWDRRDPRWLVEDRPDGRNVNSWHWEERSIKSKVQERLAELFDNLPLSLEGKPGNFKISSLREATGDASLNIRKGNKLLAIYDLSLTLAWEGQLAGNDETFYGTVKVDDFASASDEDDYIFEFGVDGGSADLKEQARALMASHAKPQIVNQLLILVRELTSLGTTTPPPDASQ